MSAPAIKVTTCIDCGMTIIGSRFRCPACQDNNAVALAETPIPAEVVRAAKMSNLVARWVVVVEAVATIILALALLARGCAR